ncbi:MAG: flagellar biosynthetic protein FliR [Desulfurobacteriaceae bacterium]
MTQIFDVNDFYAYILVLLRVASFLMAFLFIVANFIPFNVRIFLVLAFSFFVFQIVEPKEAINLETFSLVEFFLLVLKEVLVGVSLSLVVSIFTAIVVFAGELVGYSMGLTIVNIFDPTFGSMSVLSRFFVYIFYLVFFVSDAYKIFIAALVESFRLIPIGNFHLSEPLFSFILEESKLIFFLGFKLAFPFVVALFITNLILALVNRLIPQINVFIVGLPLQIFVGLFFLASGFAAIIYFFRFLTETLSKDIIKLMKILGM